MTTQGNDVILEARSIVRRYPGTLALDHVNYLVHRNKVNVLIGENGAGKSTLMRILAGVESQDEGELLLEGVPVHLKSPRDAGLNGISIVHQELSILPNLDLTENIFAGRERVKMRVLLDRSTQQKRSAKALHRLHSPLEVSTQAGYLSLGSRQLVEIARTLDQGAKILILDEPTSALSSTEADALFSVIEDLKRSGVTIIYISHRLHELLHIGDQFTVLRSGRVVGAAPRSEVSREWIVERMSGREFITGTIEDRSASNSETILGVEELSLPASCGEDEFQAAIRDVGFSLSRGEILGIYGLLGCGRTELLECLAGKRPMAKGKILVRGVQVQISSVADAVNYGILLVPEDRQRDGLFPELSVRENIVLGARKKPLLDTKEETLRTRQIVSELNIAANDFELPVAALSGGNQQKVLIARCLLRSPSILLLDEPTRGVDVGAKAEIYAILRRLAAEGLSILFTSSEIEETRALADRTLVLRQGEIAAELTRIEMTDQALFAAASPLVGSPTGAYSESAIA